MIERFWTRCRELGDDAESGQVLVEFALVFPVQLFLTLAVLQFAFLAHAHVVVNQAAFMGARAGAVAVMDPGVNVYDAGRREAVRHVALLATSNSGVSGGTVPANGQLEWTNNLGSRFGFSAARTQEAYTLANVRTRREGSSAGRGGYVLCDVTYDYIMFIPVADRFFTLMSTGGGRVVNGARTFRVRRVGFVPIPWTQGPVN